MPDIVFSPGPAEHLAFVNLRAAESDHTRSSRDFVERLWLQYHELADKNFLTEIRRDFHARFWEMYLTCALLAHAKTRGYRVSCPKPGPDVLIEILGRRIWIEAITATDGAPGNPDTLVERAEGGIGKVPEERIILRHTAALREKHNKYLRYLRDGRIAKEDAYVIAINPAALSYGWAYAAQDAPRFIKALYPLGPYQLTIDRRTGEIVGGGNQPRFSIAKANGANVPTQTFLDRRSRGISAVLCSLANAGSYARSLGTDFEIAHNPMGRATIPAGLLPTHRVWIAELSGDDGLLTGRTMNMTAHTLG